MRKLFLVIFSSITLMSFVSTNENFGTASWYGYPYHGRKTASGEVYNMNTLTAAHRTYKFGTKVQVTNVSNNKTVVVKINDRGPFTKSRDLDLSKLAFQTIASTGVGAIRIKYKILE